MTAMDMSTETRPAPRPGAWRELSELSDDNLVDRARRHDLAACEALMRRYSRRLFRIARGLLRQDGEAQEAVRETFSRAFARLDGQEMVGRFPAWLSRLALEEVAAVRARAVPALPSSAATGGLEQAVDVLPENFRMVYVMRVLEGLDVRETSESLGINPNTVRTRLFRAHRLLPGEVAQQLRADSSGVYTFGGDRGDALIAAVLTRLRS